MSVEQLIEAFGKLTASERALFLQSVGIAAHPHDFEETPEFIAFIEEGIRSANEEPLIPLDEAIKELKTWTTKAPPGFAP